MLQPTRWIVIFFFTQSKMFRIEGKLHGSLPPIRWLPYRTKDKNIKVIIYGKYTI